MAARRPLFAFVLLPTLLLAIVQPGETRPRKMALRTVEGLVASIGNHKAEGDLETLALELILSEGEEPQTILLAPRESCQEIGFEVEVGDRVRARIFVTPESPAKAHKALNLTRGTMVRFRTLRNVPLWTASGAWQGGPSQTRPGGGRRPRQQSPGPGPGGR